MEENKDLTLISVMEQEDRNSFDFQTILKTIVLNLQWFLLSLIICLGLAAIYLRYTTPVYQVYTKLLIKDDENTNNRGRNSIMNSETLGLLSNSTGIDNEMEILKSHSIATQTVRDLKLYVTYMSDGKIKDQLIYKTQGVNVDIDPAHLDKLTAPIYLEMK